jgi:hypothetical protein
MQKQHKYTFELCPMAIKLRTGNNRTFYEPMDNLDFVEYKAKERKLI